MRFYLVVNLDKANAADCAAEAATELLRCGAEVLLTPELNAVLNCSGCQVLDEREAMQSCDAAISIGGDGTMIHTALDALEFDRRGWLRRWRNTMRCAKPGLTRYLKRTGIICSPLQRRPSIAAGRT